MRQANDSTGALSKGLGGVKGAIGMVGGAFAAVQVGGFFKDAIMGASDLAETMSKVGVVFGDSQKQVTAFADQMAKDFGLPKREILDAASSIGLIGKASGLSEGDAAGMATQLGKLAADASSFYNVPLPEALQAIQSGLVGEAEPMRRFGVLLNAQAVDAEAARMGLEKVNGAYTEGAKAQARASLIMAGMTDASGDLERTQGSLSNRLRELKGRFQNFTAELGAKAVPIILKLMDGFEAFGQRVGPIISQVGGALKQVFTIFTERDFVGGPFQEDSSFIDTVFKVRDALVNFVQTVVAWFRANWPRIKEIVSEAMETVKSVIQNVVTIVMTIWNNFGSQIVAVLRSAWDFVTDIVDAAMNVIRGIIDVVTGLIKGDWGQVWEGIKAIFSGVWDAIKAVVSTAIDVVKEIISAGWEIVKGIFSGAWNAIVEGVKTAAGWLLDEIRAIPGRIVGALGDLGSLLWDAGKAIIQGLIGGIKNMVGAAVDAVKDAIGGVISGAKRMLGIGSPSKVFIGFGQDVMAGMAIGMGKGESGVISQLAHTTKAMGVVPGLSVSGGHAAAAATRSGGGGGGTQVIQLVVDGQVLAQVVREQLQRKGSQVGEGNLFRHFGSAA